MKFAFKATTTIAILSLALLAFSPEVLALSATITGPDTVPSGTQYNIVVYGEGPGGATINVQLQENGSPIVTKSCKLSVIGNCVNPNTQAPIPIIEQGFMKSSGKFNYTAVVTIQGVTGQSGTSNVKTVTVGTGAGGTTPSGGTTPTGGPLKGENLPSTGAPTLFGLTTGGADLLKTIDDIGNWVFVFLIAVAAIFLIVAGFMYITAAGSTENLTKAKQMLINALIGVVIALLARGMVQVIRTILGG